MGAGAWTRVSWRFDEGRVLVGWGFPKLECSHDASAVGVAEAMLAVRPSISRQGVGGAESK